MSIPPGSFSGPVQPQTLGSGEPGPAENRDDRAWPHAQSSDVPVGTPPSAPALVEKPHPLTPLVRAWVLVLAVAWTIGRDLLGRPEGLRLPPLTWVTGGVGAVLVTLLVVAYLDWRATSFIVDHGELRIETGVFTKTSQRIRFDRIQSVDITEPFAARLLGLAEVTIDVGAEGGHKLRYLSRARAAADARLPAGPGARPSGRPRSDRSTSTTGVLDDLGRRRRGAGAGAAAAADHRRGAVPRVPAAHGAAAGDDRGGDRARPTRHRSVVLRQSLAAARGCPAGAGRLWSFVVHRVIGQWNYAFVRSGPGPEDHPRPDQPDQPVGAAAPHPVVADRAAAVVAPARVCTGWTWRCSATTGWPTDEDGVGTTSILLPIGTRADLELVLATIWPGLRLDRIDVRPSPERARWLQPFSHRWVGWGWDDTVLVTRNGWLTQVQMIVPHARVQSLAAEQGPLQAAVLGLATVSVHTTEMLAVCAARNLDADAGPGSRPAARETRPAPGLDGLFSDPA